MDKETINDLRNVNLRVMAHNVVLLGLVRTHLDAQQLRDAIEPFAEATRALLLGSDWTDVQVQVFERCLGQLLNTLPPPSAK